MVNAETLLDRVAQLDGPHFVGLLLLAACVAWALVGALQFVGEVFDSLIDFVLAVFGRRPLHGGKVEDSDAATFTAKTLDDLAGNVTKLEEYAHDTHSEVEELVQLARAEADATHTRHEQLVALLRERLPQTSEAAS